MLAYHYIKIEADGGALKLEKRLQSMLTNKRRHIRGEWFWMTPKEAEFLSHACQTGIDLLGLEFDIPDVDTIEQ